MSAASGSAASIGAMRHRLILERPSRVGDGGGGAFESWIAVAEVWAAIHPLVGSELVVGEAVEGRSTHAIDLRYRTGIIPSMRFRFGARVFEIVGVIDAGERRRRLRCHCREVRL